MLCSGVWFWGFLFGVFFFLFFALQATNPLVESRQEMILHEKSDRKKEQCTPINVVLSRKQQAQTSAHKIDFYVVKFLTSFMNTAKQVHRKLEIGRKSLTLYSPLL